MVELFGVLMEEGVNLVSRSFVNSIRVRLRNKNAFKCNLLERHFCFKKTNYFLLIKKAYFPTTLVH